MPIAARCYFVTFTTYGTHLLGDARGSTRWDGSRINPCEPLRRYMSDTLAEPSFIMNRTLRAATHDAIHNVGFSENFYIDALNVRSNHVHLVVCALNGQTAGCVVAALKREARRVVRLRLAPNDSDRPIWTKSFSAIEIHRIAAWRAFVRYTLFRQGDNSYMSRTHFARRAGIRFDADSETISASLGLAYKVNQNAKYRAKLFDLYAQTQQIQEEVEFAEALINDARLACDENNEHFARK